MKFAAIIGFEAAGGKCRFYKPLKQGASSLVSQVQTTEMLGRIDADTAMLIAQRDAALSYRDTALSERDAAVEKRKNIVAGRTWRWTAWYRRMPSSVS